MQQRCPSHALAAAPAPPWLPAAAPPAQHHPAGCSPPCTHLPQVTYPHAASRAEFLLGLFESEEETKRVRDVLTSE